MKKGINAPAIVVGVAAAGLIAAVSVLGVRISRNGSVEGKAQPNNTTASYNTIAQQEETTAFDYTYETEAASAEESTSVTAPSTTVKQTAAKKAATKVATTIAKTTQLAISGTKVDVVVDEEVTMPVLKEEDTKKGAAPAASSTVDSSLPNDMYFTGLQRSGFSVIGPKTFIYND